MAQQTKILGIQSAHRIGKNPFQLVWIIMVMLASSSQAQIPSAEQLRSSPVVQNSASLRGIDQVLDKRGSVVFRDTPIQEVIYTLAQQWNINIVAGAEIAGNVTGNFKDSPLREILDSLLLVNGYGYRHNGNSLLILKQDQIGPNNPNFRPETLLLPRNLSNKALSEVVGALRVFSSPNGGQLHPVPSNNTLMVYDTQEKIAQMKLMLSNLTNGQAAPGLAPGTISAQVGSGSFPLDGARMANVNEIIRIRPQFIPASEMAKAIELALGNAGSFIAIDAEETLLITGSPEALQRVTQVCCQIDLPRPQVRITAYIYDVSLGELERLGFDWSNQFMSQGVDANGIPRNMVRNDAGLLTRGTATPIVGNASPLGATTGTTGGGAGGAATAGAATGGQWVFRTLSNNFELNTVLQALDETKGSKLLADPHITVVDRQTASINIVTKIPIQQLTQTQQGGSLATTAFEEAGIKLDVIPRIANDGTVEMKVSPEFSVLTGFNNGNPVIDARRASTVVRIAHQHTLVIGGLRQKTAVETVRGIPGLMNWKFIGPLFRSHNTELRESELIVFIQPEIVDTFQTGLPREEIALSQQKSQLGQIPMSCPGPNVPNCKDPHCPYHHPRPRVNHGMQDEGFVFPGSLPSDFTTPASAMIPYGTYTGKSSIPQPISELSVPPTPMAPIQSSPIQSANQGTTQGTNRNPGVIIPAQIYNGP